MPRKRTPDNFDWVAVRTDSSLPWSFPHFGGVRDGQLFHWGGPSHMGFDRTRVLKRYGTMALAEAEANGLFEQVYRDFPPYAGTVADVFTAGAAWLSPGGAVYPCHYMGHSFLAQRICKLLGITHAKTVRNEDDLLMKAGWLRVTPTVISWYEVDAITEVQLSVLFDLVRCAQQRGQPELLTEFDRLLRYRDSPRQQNDTAEEDQRDTPPLPQAVLDDLNALRAPPSSANPPTSSFPPEHEPKRRFVLKEQPYIEVTLRFYRSHDESSGQGVCAFGFEPCCTRVTADDGSEQGAVEGRMGGFYVQDEKRPFKHAYVAPHDEVWYAFQRALDAAPDQATPATSATKTAKGPQ